MHVDVETRGEFTRGETVANRMGSDENNVLHGDHYEIEGVIELKPNARVCLGLGCGSLFETVHQPDQRKVGSSSVSARHQQNG